MNDPERIDRAAGALLGLACGDALGAPLVGMGRDQARIKHGLVETFLGGGLYLLPPGEVTARVRLARAAGLGLLSEPPWRDAVLTGYVEVFESESPGLGEATHAALARISEGTPPEEAARQAHDAVERRTAGIGPALRAVPYALRLWHDPEAMINAVLADARLTHHDPRAHAAAAALALWVRELVAEPLDAAAALERVRDRLADRLGLPDVLPPPAAVEARTVRATAFAPDVLHAVVRHAVPARSPGRAIAGAVNEAGAAAALGAATGAVAGTAFGASALPRGWTELLVGGRRWRGLAERLLAQAG